MVRVVVVDDEIFAHLFLCGERVGRGAPLGGAVRTDKYTHNCTFF